MDKRGQIFALFLVFLTLFMCGSVILLYYSSQDKVSASLVSPRAVLDMRDDVKIFEMNEISSIKSALEEASKKAEFGTKEFSDSFKDSFFSKLKIYPLITERVYQRDQDVSEGARLNTALFLRNALYPESLTYYDGKNLYFGRASLEKRTRLETSDKLKNNFVVDSKFSFDKKYLISKSGNEFVVKEA